MYQVTNFIDGKECLESNESISIINPSYGIDIGEVLYATKNSANNAVEAAAERFKTWSKSGLSYRAELILKLRQGIIDRSDEIINICVSEAGKTRPDAEAELDRAIQALQSEKDHEVATLQDDLSVQDSKLSAQDDRITQLELALTELLRERNDNLQVGALN